MMRAPGLIGWAILAVMAWLPCVATAETLVVDGVERNYLVEPAGAQAAPVLIVLHGGQGNARQMQRYAGLDGGSVGMHVVYPDAKDGRWGDGRRLRTAACSRRRMTWLSLMR